MLCDRLPGDPSELEAFQKECLVVEIEEEAAAALRHLTVAQKYESEMGKPRRESRVESRRFSAQTRLCRRNCRALSRERANKPKVMSITKYIICNINNRDA